MAATLLKSNAQAVKARGFGFCLALESAQAVYVIEGADCAAMGQKPDERSR